MTENNLSAKALAILAARREREQAEQEVQPASSVNSELNKPAQELNLQNHTSLLASFADMVPNLADDLSADAPETPDQTAEQQLDTFIDTLSFKEAYEKFSNKGPIKWSGADDNNMIRCPRTDHEDKNPSVAFRISTKVWKCYACDDGGGVVDLVGATMGKLSVQDRKGKNYHDIRRHIGKAYGWDVFKRSDGTTGVYPPEHSTQPPATGGKFADLLRKAAPASTASPEPAAEAPASVAAPAEPAPEQRATVLQLVQPKSDDEGEHEGVHVDTSSIEDVDWRTVFAEDSFVRAYMDANCNDDSPEMYHLWSALLAVGLTTGRNVTLWDQPAVYGNLCVTLLGDTGQGKSRSRVPLLEVLRDLMPYDPDEIIPEGAILVPNPKTGEGLTSAFARTKRTKDPKTGAITVEYLGNVKGLATFEEFSEIVKLVGKPGATLDTVIMAGADCGGAVMGGTTKGDGVFQAEQHYMSAWSSTQPDRLGDLFNNSDKSSGFLNRWVFIAGKEKPRLTFNHGSSADLTRAKLFYTVLRDSVRARGQYQYSLMPDALEEFDRFIQKVVLPEMRSGNSPMLQRMNLLMKKLLLLLSVNAGEDKVSINTVRQAKAFYPYLLSCYTLIDNSIGLPTKSEFEDYIYSIIKRYQDGPKKKASDPEHIPLGGIWDTVRKNPRAKEGGREVMLKSLDILEKIGLIRRYDSPPGKKGKPTEFFEAVEVSA